MTAHRKYAITTPAKVRDCINAGMSVRRAAEHLGVSEQCLRQACSLFGWSPHGWSGPKPNTKTLKAPPKRGAHNPFGALT